MSAAVLVGGEFADFDSGAAEMEIFGVGGLALTGDSVVLDMESPGYMPRELGSDFMGTLALFDVQQLDLN